MSRLTIAPIGTCRIHTPLREGAKRYPFSLELGRNYGFVHSPLEALQQFDLMMSGAAIPADIAKLLCRPTLSAASYHKPHVPADLYLVEISSRKDWTVDGTPVQSNYAARYFNEFFSDRERSRRFWAAGGEQQDGERRAWLETEAVFRRLPAEDQALLARLRKRELDDSEIEWGMAALAERIGQDRLVFVSHINAMLPDDRPIEARQGLIALTKSVAKRLGVPCYDPTVLMRELGQINAMEKNGLDLTHYTDAFAQRLCADWYARFFVGRISGAGARDTSPAAADAATVASIEDLWTSGRIAEASRLVREALRRNPDLVDHRLVLGRIQFELGEYEGAIANLERVHDEFGPTDETGLILMRAYFRLGDYRNARTFATSLLSDETDSAEIIQISAISAAHLGATDAALADWTRLFRLADDKEAAATAALALLQAGDDPEQTNAWAGEVLAELPQHTASFAVQWDYLLARSDRRGLIGLAHRAMPLDEATGLGLVERATAAGYATPAALLLIHGGLIGSDSAPIASWVARQSAVWLEDGMAALATGALLKAADALQARWQLRPNGNQLIRARRTLEQQFRREVRQAFVDKNHSKVVELIAAARDTLTEFPEIDTFLGRSMDALGESAAALEPLKRAAQEDGAPLGTKVQLARVAVRSGRYLDALDAYADVVAHHPAESWAREEAERQLHGLEGRSIRAARAQVANDQHDQAWALLDRLDRLHPGNPKVEREKARVLASLRAQARLLDPAAADERFNLGQAILKLVPGDEVGLKMAAGGAMRMHRFEVALTHWQTLRAQTADTAQIDINIQKCQLWIDRAQRKLAA